MGFVGEAGTGFEDRALSFFDTWEIAGGGEG